MYRKSLYLIEVTKKHFFSISLNWCYDKSEVSFVRRVVVLKMIVVVAFVSSCHVTWMKWQSTWTQWNIDVHPKLFVKILCDIVIFFLKERKDRSRQNMKIDRVSKKNQQCLKFGKKLNFDVRSPSPNRKRLLCSNRCQNKIEISIYHVRSQ